MRRALAWLDRIDPGTNRRIKGLRLVTAYAIAAMAGMLPGIAHATIQAPAVSSIAAGFALWASVSEGRATRAGSSRDLALLVIAAGCGAALMAYLTPLLEAPGWPGAELTLISGAFLVSFLKRFGVTGAGIGSQIYIGQILAYGAGLTPADLGTIGLCTVIAMPAAIVPRVLSGPAEHPSPSSPVVTPGQAIHMGAQAAIAALVIVLLNDAVGLEESVWAVTACTYVIAGSTASTLDRVRRRVLGTLIGVPLGLACLPLALHLSLVVWAAAAMAMVVYAMALPERYDIACGAYAFTLIVTLAATSASSPFLLAARAWETLLGGALGLVTALLAFPLRTEQR